MRKCHYEILDIDASASVADIRKAYRKKALELHPDKNMDRVAQATAAFALVQEAHEVLSDPAERSWYDAHKEAILSGRSTSDGIYYSGTDAAALMTFFSSGVWTSYGWYSKSCWLPSRHAFSKSQDLLINRLNMQRRLPEWLLYRFQRSLS